MERSFQGCSRDRMIWVSSSRVLVFRSFTHDSLTEFRAFHSSLGGVSQRGDGACTSSQPSTCNSTSTLISRRMVSYRTAKMILEKYIQRPHLNLSNDMDYQTALPHYFNPLCLYRWHPYVVPFPYGKAVCCFSMVDVERLPTSIPASARA
jgi:hypothetical protein